ncbi:MAG: ABC transporter permease [Candidatus Omnitrophica bacterium]|nr:ABC transporter permease [Candidatus Omnitrophota bacterium]
MFKELFQYRDLLFMLTFRDIRIRYKQAAMGFLWALFMPLVAVAAGILIKKAMAVVSGQYVDLEGIISISVKVLPWTFFVSSIRFAVQSLVGNSDLVTKIYFPRAVLPISSVFACLFDLTIAMIFLAVLLTIVKIGISVQILWLPFLLAVLVLLTIGIGLVLSAANLFFRDVKYIVEIILMFGIFFTPVFYDAQAFGNWSTLLLLNPVGSILDAINRVVVLKQAPLMNWLSYATAVSAGIFFTGMKIFEAKESSFAENI